MGDDLRQRYTGALTTAWNKSAVVCEHSQIIPLGALADAMLSVRDEELERLRERVAGTERVAKVNGGLYRSAEGDVTAAASAIARVRALADTWRAEPHPTHDHVCPDGMRAELLAALDGPAVSEEQTGDADA